jgi:hypothetical protein
MAAKQSTSLSIRFASVALLVVLSGCGGASAPTPPAESPPPVTKNPVPPPAPVQDDTAALQALLGKGGLIRLEARAYHLTKTLIIAVSGTTLQGAGPATVLEFTPPPAGTAQHCITDRVISTRCAISITVPLQIAAPIEVGNTSFEAVNAADVANLSPGDWVLISESDPGIADAVTHTGYPTSIDWVQVASVEGTTVSTVQPSVCPSPHRCRSLRTAAVSASRRSCWSRM